MRDAFLRLSGRSLAVFLLVTGTLAVSSEAATLVVATNGTATSTCTSAAPCRSLTRAIALAKPGDRIIVGPGRYGDVDLDGTFGDPGDEAGPVAGVSAGVITVNKAVAIESRDGAGATILDARGATNADVVHIAASGVVFGKPGQGFTLTGASSGRCGLVTRLGTTDVSVAGNVAVANGFCGFNHGGDSAEFSANKAIANGQHGFLVWGNGVRFEGNLAAQNLGDGATSGDGFNFSSAENVELVRNVAVGNGRDGLHGDGFSDGLTMIQNSFVGNARFGVIVLGGDAVIDRANVFGNGATGGTFVNCGLRHLGTGSITRVFFGRPGGPGADPRDENCGTVPVTSFSAIEIAVPDPLK